METPPGRTSAQRGQSPAGVQHHHQGREGEGSLVDFCERLQHGGHEVGAGADRFGNHDLGPGRRIQGFDRFHQLIKAAAKAAAGDLSDIRRTLRRRTGRGRVHEPLALVVGDEGHLPAAFFEGLGQATDESGLARPEEAADEQEMSLCLVLRTRICNFHK